MSVLVFVAFLAARHERYLCHERWTDFRLTYATPTEGEEFVAAGAGGLRLNPQMATRIEARLDAGEVVALHAEATRPFWAKSEPQDWLDRVCSVTLEKDTHPFVARVHTYLKDADRAERTAQMVSDEVLQFGGSQRFQREREAELRPLEQELRDAGGVMSPELHEKFQRASGGSWLSIQHISRMDRFYPKASAGKAIVWWRLGEAVAQAILGALVCGILAQALRAKLGKRAALSP